MTYIVGLTGGIGSGKSTIANLFSALGVPIVDADLVAREVLSYDNPCWQEILANFGEEILLNPYSINRRKLRKIIFHDPLKKQVLESILHPFIRTECLRQLHEKTSQYVIFAVPLLIEQDLHSLCQSVLVVDVSVETQLLRASLRDKNSIDLIRKIINSQVSREKRLQYATEIIENNLDISTNFLNLAQQVFNLHQRYLNLAKLTKAV